MSAAGAQTAKPRRTVHLRIALPAAAHAGVVRLHFVVAAPKGRLAHSIKLRTTNDAALPDGIRAVAGVVYGLPRKRTMTVFAYVLINNLTPASPRSLADESTTEIDLAGVTAEGEAFKGNVKYLVETKDCKTLVPIGNDADTPAGNLNALGTHWSLEALRATDKQPSDPEAVLDHTVYNLCQAQGAEEPEDGPG